MVRPASTCDLPALQAVERAAGAVFRELGMDAVAEDDPAPVPELQQFVDGDRAWVIDRDGRVAACVLVRVLDGCGHVEQVPVRPRHARQRLGAALLEHVAGWACHRGLPALTLTTVGQVPWNGPYYLRCGCRWLPDSALTPGLHALRAAEAAHGVGWPRGWMRRDLP